MKKTLLSVLVAAMLLVGVAGQALAYFDELHLIRAVYNTQGEYEVLTDLGTGYDFRTDSRENPSFQNIVLNTNNFSLTDMQVSDFSGVYVQYFILSTLATGTNGIWLSGQESGLRSVMRNWNNAMSPTLTLLTNNRSTEVEQNVWLQTTPLAAFSEVIGQSGYYTSFLTTPGARESLTGFNAEGQQYVDQYLYYWNAAQVNTAYSPAQYAVIRTLEDGTTIINPTDEVPPEVPLPAAAYLLATGLLALVGIRRRNA